MVNIEHARRLARVSLLCACALVLSYLETMIPLPVAVPGIKLGLAAWP
ncbi:MAG: Gx transporter family protein [Collinsella sp.]